MSAGKLMELQQLGAWARERQRVVLCHGVWDILHAGHLQHLKKARSLGDALVVTVTADAHVHKGPGRPVFPETARAEMLAALEVVDAVSIVDDPSALPAILAVHPAFYVKGEEYRSRDGAGNLESERRLVESFGGRLEFAGQVVMSSTQVINSIMPRVAPETQAALKAISDRWTAKDMLGWMERARLCSPAVMGEAIEDEYVYVEPEGKSAKDSIVVHHQIARRSFRGGVLIVGDHLASLYGRSAVHAPARVIRKRRYVMLPFLQKVFSVVMDTETENWAPPLDRVSDVTIAMDFGHGAFRGGTMDAVAAAAKFLALTVQSNSLNWGYNVVSKWPRADYVVLDEEELRLAYRDRSTSLEELARRLMGEMSARIVAVTHGHLGCIVLNGDGAFHLPALADKVIDRMGAGDAFLAATAPLAAVGAPKEVIALIGNVAGALHVGVEGNQPLKRTEVEQWIVALLTS